VRGELRTAGMPPVDTALAPLSLPAAAPGLLPAAAAEALPAAAAATRPAASGRPPTGWQAFRQGCRQMFGIPDFDRYLAHMQATHPGAPVLSEREFHAMAIDRRYGAGRPRCC
jgi:uncharacterized short protein YbdD (DUF466 family)